jgi:cell division septation protein DedD
MRKIACLLLLTSCLAGCDQIKERAGFPDPARVDADGKAIGGACRHAGRGLEDCYHLNLDASKSAIYAGWKEMNEYMAKNNMVAMPPTVPAEATAPAEPTPPKKHTDAAEADAKPKKKAADDQ